MSKRPNRKLKVFEARLGFWDTVVAAPSQAAALRIWGTSQNLFARGDAKVATEKEAISAAMAHPETLLRRPIGSKDPFTQQPTGLPTLPDEPKKAKVRDLVAKRKPAVPPRPPKPASRAKLDEAEAALKALDEDRKQEETGFRRDQAELDKRREAAEKNYVTARKAATSRVVRERTLYRDAGG
jgi:type IV secretory pathway VirB10-like protein